MPLYAPSLIFLYVLVFSVAEEELGWRGLALPRLLSRYSPVRSSLIPGAIWALWHLPLFFVPGNFNSEIPFALFAVQIIAFSVISTQLHPASQRSLLIARLFHAAFNTTAGLLPILPHSRFGDTLPLMIGVGSLAVWAVFVGRRMARGQLT